MRMVASRSKKVGMASIRVSFTWLRAGLGAPCAGATACAHDGEASHVSNSRWFNWRKESSWACARAAWPALFPAATASAVSSPHPCHRAANQPSASCRALCMSGRVRGPGAAKRAWAPVACMGPLRPPSRALFHLPQQLSLPAGPAAAPPPPSSPCSSSFPSRTPRAGRSSCLQAQHGKGVTCPCCRLPCPLLPHPALPALQLTDKHDGGHGLQGAQGRKGEPRWAVQRTRALVIHAAAIPNSPKACESTFVAHPRQCSQFHKLRAHGEQAEPNVNLARWGPDKLRFSYA